MKFLLFISLFFTSNTYCAVSFEELTTLKTALQKAFKELRPNQSHSLDINKVNEGMPVNFWWDLNDVHASYSGYDDEDGTYHSIFLFGGFARLEGMTLDGLALTACHEIGHGIGLGPYKESGSTTEGQADYYAAKTCLPVVFKYLDNLNQLNPSYYVQHLCSEQKFRTYGECVRLFYALESDLYFLDYLGDSVSFESRSSYVEVELNLSDYHYPDAQCRIDTGMNAILGIRRPVCWYPASEPDEE